MADTYSMEAHCNNCSETWTVHIPKGTSAHVYEKTIVCDNCGCGNISVRRELRFGEAIPTRHL